MIAPSFESLHIIIYKLILFRLYQLNIFNCIILPMTCLQPTVVCRSIVRIDGATGVNAGNINGLYEPTEEMVGHTSVYRKVGENDTLIEYIESAGKW